MRLVALGLLLLWRGLAVGQEVLIVQIPKPTTGSENPNVAVSTHVAEAFAEEGRVVPIVWALSDPLFRAWHEARKVEGKIEAPTLEHALATANRHRILFRLVLEAVSQGPAVVAKAELYRSGEHKPVWTKEDSVTVLSVNEPDYENAARSLARSWCAQLGQGPFRRYPPRKNVAPLPEPRPEPEPPKPPPPPKDDEAIARAAELTRDGRLADAITLLRDAVDAQPLNPRRRASLARALLGAGRYAEAAEQARRAPGNDPEVRLVAARAWLLLGEPNEAEADLKAAREGAPTRSEVHLLAGEIALFRLDAAIASSEFESAKKAEDTYDARLGLAVAAALAGDSALVRTITDDLPVPAEDLRLAAYARCVRIARRAVDAIAEDLREVLRLGRLKKDLPEAIAKGERATRRSRALELILERLGSSGEEGARHERRVLAHKLLTQAGSEATAFVRAGDETLDGDATLNLGEALRRLAELDEQP